MKYAIDKTVYIDKNEITEVKAIEHDTKTRFINFKFVGNNTAIDLTGCKVRIYAKNSRYIEIFNDLTVVDAKKGIAQLELTDKFLRPGITEYQLKIMPIGGGQLSSNTMQIVVGKDLMQGNAIESSNEYKSFEEALNKIDKYDLRWQNGNIKTKDSVLFENAVLKAADTLLYNNNKIYDTAHKPTVQEIGASPSNHNHDDRYLKKEVGATNESFRFRTKFLEFGIDDSRIGEIGVGPNDTYIHNTKSDKYLALKDDGRLLYNNKEVCDKGHFLGDPGLNGYQMLPSGLLMQWGYVEMGKDTTKIVNFPKSFKNFNYNLQISVYGGPGRVPAVKTYHATYNNFSIQCEAEFNVYWLAIGAV